MGFHKRPVYPRCVAMRKSSLGSKTVMKSRRSSDLDQNSLDIAQCSGETLSCTLLLCLFVF